MSSRAISMDGIPVPADPLSVKEKPVPAEPELDQVAFANTVGRRLGRWLFGHGLPMVAGAAAFLGLWEIVSLFAHDLPGPFVTLTLCITFVRGNFFGDGNRI